MVLRQGTHTVGRTLAVASIPVVLAVAQSLSLASPAGSLAAPVPARASLALDRLDQHLARAEALQAAPTVLPHGVRAALPIAALPVASLPQIDISLTGGPLQVALINVDRAQAGLALLSQSPVLQRVAELRAVDMLARSYFSHVDPATGTLAFLELFQSLHVAYRSAGENIAWSASPSAETFNAWFMQSPDHRDNLLNPGFRQVGVGLASAGGRTVIAEIFTG